MDSKEIIDTLVTTGATLPPINPYLDDGTGLDASDLVLHPIKKRGKKPAKKEKTHTAPKAITIQPDPKEYIAELERSEEDVL